MKKPKPRARPTGRPIKDAPPGRTVQLGVLVAAGTKAIIAEAARASGRSLSREAEALIERALAYDRQFQAMGTSLEQIKQGNLEIELRKAGYMPIRGPRGTAWLEPGHADHPGRSGFVEWSTGELAAQGAGVSDEDTERRNRAKIEANDRGPRFDMDGARRQLEEIAEISNVPKKDHAA
jgi:hypothetical protein